MENMGFVTAGVLPGKLNSLVKNLMKQMNVNDPEEAVRRINSWEYIASPAHKWQERNDEISFSVTSDGTTGAQWIGRLMAKGYRIDDNAIAALQSSDFRPTRGVKTEVVILKGEIFEDEMRYTQRIYDEADRRKLIRPNPEVACLIRNKFTDEEIEKMGLMWIVVMSESLRDPSKVPFILVADRYNGGRWLYARFNWSKYQWLNGYGFAFAVSQVQV